jgi:hypothetical protein
MSKKDITTLMYEDIITIDPRGARFACKGTDKHGIDRLGPALPEQKREWQDSRKAAQRKSNLEIFVTNLFFGVVLAAFLLGRLSLGSNPIEDSQTILTFMAGLMK